MLKWDRSAFARCSASDESCHGRRPYGTSDISVAGNAVARVLYYIHRRVPWGLLLVLHPGCSQDHRYQLNSQNWKRKVFSTSSIKPIHEGLLLRQFAGQHDVDQQETAISRTWSIQIVGSTVSTTSLAHTIGNETFSDTNMPQALKEVAQAHEPVQPFGRTQAPVFANDSNILQNLSLAQWHSCIVNVTYANQSLVCFNIAEFDTGAVFAVCDGCLYRVLTDD